MRLYFDRISSVASIQVRELLRSHPLRIFLPAAGLLIVAAPALIFFSFGHRENIVVQIGVSAATVTAVLIGLLAGCGGVARDRLSGTRDLLLARSLPVWTYVLGKWVGILAILALAVGFLGIVHLASLTARGGAPQGSLPIVAALLVAVAYGACCAALALFLSTLFRSGPAFVISLLVLAAGHVVHLVGDSTILNSLAWLLPRFPNLNLAVESAFGPFSSGVWIPALLHGAAYSCFLIAVAVPLAGRPVGGKT